MPRTSSSNSAKHKVELHSTLKDSRGEVSLSSCQEVMPKLWANKNPILNENDIERISQKFAEKRNIREKKASIQKIRIIKTHSEVLKHFYTKNILLKSLKFKLYYFGLGSPRRVTVFGFASFPSGSRFT